MDALVKPPAVVNEPVYDYVKGSAARTSLEAELKRLAGEQIEVPCIIGGERVRTGQLDPIVMPHDHQHVLGRFHVGGPKEMDAAINAALAAKPVWEAMSWSARAGVFLRAAELFAGKYRMLINAATMLGQGKTSHQAEIDAACELIDFLRYNCQFASELYQQQPSSSPGMWNMLELRPLEGFVLAMTPFNFTAIAANLPAAPALMGNTVVWKPSESQMFSAYYTMMVFEEAGLPPGVINLVPGYGHVLAPVALAHREFAGLHFTGSTDVFRSLWQTTGQNLRNYRSYPRIVGETGGKDFIVAHPSADPAAVATAIIRGGYEYSGQKCSAASRVYLPESVWSKTKTLLADTISGIPMGDVRDFRNFMGAVIKQAAFDRHKAAIEAAKKSSDCQIIAGGECDDKKGYFVRPTLIHTTDPNYVTMREELFGPIVTLYVYPDKEWANTLSLVDQTSPYALTGAVFAGQRTAIEEARVALRHSAGNFYINDKPTGAVVGQQPFGGARASGTNDKAGAPMNLLRWTSARTIKETFVPPTDYRYPFMMG